MEDWDLSFEDNIQWKIGDGKNIRVYEDTWVGNMPSYRKIS